MKNPSKTTLIQILNLAVIIVPLFVLVVLLWPSLPLWGYSHSVPSGDSGYHITITSQPLFHVLSDDYYPISLRAGYLTMFFLEVFAVFFSFLLFAFLIQKTDQLFHFFLFLTLALTISLDTMVLYFFHQYLYCLNASVLSLALHITETIGNLVYLLLLKKRKTTNFSPKSI